MIRTLTAALCGLIFITTVGCALAAQLGISGNPITVEAYVHDSDGSPVEGATVILALPRYGEPIKIESDKKLTNQNGIAILSGIAQQDYSIAAEKPGYYRTTGPHRSLTTEKGLQQYANGVQKNDLELRLILNPVPGIGKFIDRLLIPAEDTSVGFDMEAGDWVEPYGNGKTGDLIFRLEGRYNGMNDYDQTLTLNFSNKGDGILVMKFSAEIGPQFKFPYEAPLAGYGSQRVWRAAFDGKARIASGDFSGETNYIFRVRTKLDVRGNVVRALYGVITSEVSLGGNNETGRNISFVYRLNPNWTRNIEFDPQLGARAGTGKLLVQPPPDQ